MTQIQSDKKKKNTTTSDLLLHRKATSVPRQCQRQLTRNVKLAQGDVCAQLLLQQRGRRGGKKKFLPLFDCLFFSLFAVEAGLGRHAQ